MNFDILSELRPPLNPAIARYIKRKEKYLGRKCGKIWTHTTPKGEKYAFAHFCHNWDRLIVTIAYFHPQAHLWVTPR
jgi:hypothetical protein